MVYPTIVLPSRFRGRNGDEFDLAEQAEYSLVLTHDVETGEGLRGVSMLAELEESMGFRSSWNIVPYKYKIDAGLIADLKARGHEVAIHGYNHDGRLFMNRSIFEARVPLLIVPWSSTAPSVFAPPMVHRNLRWMQKLNIEYDASCFDVDPFQAMPGGVQGIWPFRVGKFIELPYTMPQDHTLLISLGETTDQIWRRKLEFLGGITAWR